MSSHGSLTRFATARRPLKTHLVRPAGLVLLSSVDGSVGLSLIRVVREESCDDERVAEAAKRGEPSGVQ